MNRVLIVEDCPSVNTALASVLRTWCRVDQVTNLHGACNHLIESNDPYDVIILDRVLPDGDGLDLLRFVQLEEPHTKTCILSKRNAEHELLHALQRGADAYLPKPVSPQVVNAHVRALLRRGKTKQADCQFCDLELFAAARLARRRDQQVQLSKREAQFLATFLRSTDGRATRDQLSSIYWNDGSPATGSVIHVTIQRLRKKLNPLAVTIESIYGLGYRLALD